MEYWYVQPCWMVGNVSGQCALYTSMSMLMCFVTSDMKSHNQDNAPGYGHELNSSVTYFDLKVRVVI